MKFKEILLKVFAGVFWGLAIIAFIWEYTWWAVAVLAIGVVFFLLLCLLIEIGLRDTCGGSLNAIDWVWRFLIGRGFKPLSHESAHPIQYPEHALEKDGVKVVLRFNAPLLKSHRSITVYLNGVESKEWTFPLDADHDEVYRIIDDYLKQENM